MQAPIPPNEAARLGALRRYKILDTASEQAFDEITFLAAHICVVPIALIAFIDSDREWFKSKVGLTMTGISRDLSFTAHALMQPDLFVVEDAGKDERFAANPLFTAYPYIRAYTGAAIVTPDGQTIGALAVVDRMPRKLRPEQEEALRALSRQVVTQLELRRNLVEMERIITERTLAEAVLRDSERKFRELVESAPDAIVIANREGRIELVNARAEAMFGYRRDELIGEAVECLIPQQYRKNHVQHRVGYTAEPRLRSMGAGLEITAHRKDGGDFPVEVSLSPMETNDGVRVIAFVRDISSRKQN